MKCFIASAFGRSDVDALFDRAIKPTLRSLGVTSIRVDRHEHNDDIDDTIFRLMAGADFGIVDLSYARPSAYFEAGHLIGSGKPVVFIARADHFRDKDDDPEGTRVIHFDLKMKNVIPWVSPNDVFRSKLRKRIGIVIRPLLQKRKRLETELADAEEFSRLSQSSQSAAVTASAERLLRRSGFSIEKPDYPTKSTTRRWIRSNDRRRTILVIFNQPKFSKTDIQYLDYFSIPMVSKEESKRLRAIAVVFVICSTRSISRLSFRNYYKAHEQLSDGSLYRAYERTSEPLTAATSKRICFIEKIISTSDFEVRFGAALSSLR